MQRSQDNGRLRLFTKNVFESELLNKIGCFHSWGRSRYENNCVPTGTNSDTCPALRGRGIAPPNISGTTLKSIHQGVRPTLFGRCNRPWPDLQERTDKHLNCEHTEQKQAARTVLLALEECDIRIYLSGKINQAMHTRTSSIQSRCIEHHWHGKATRLLLCCL